MARQHERLRVPQGWDGQAKALIQQLERIHDDIYSRLGDIVDVEADVAAAQEDIEDLGTMDSNIESAIGIISDGDTHINVNKGQYIFVKNHDTLTTGLYCARNDIAANATLSSSNVYAVPYGLGDALATTNYYLDFVFPAGNIASVNALVERACIGSNKITVFSVGATMAENLSNNVNGPGFGITKHITGSNRVDYVLFQPVVGTITLGTINTLNGANTVTVVQQFS